MHHISVFYLSTAFLPNKFVRSRATDRQPKCCCVALTVRASTRHLTFLSAFCFASAASSSSFSSTFRRSMSCFITSKPSTLMSCCNASAKFYAHPTRGDSKRKRKQHQPVSSQQQASAFVEVSETNSTDADMTTHTNKFTLNRYNIYLNLTWRPSGRQHAHIKHLRMLSASEHMEKDKISASLAINSHALKS